MPAGSHESAPDPLSEWPYSLDVDALLATGWRPVPFQDFILKIHSRCDLSCDYCYMYFSADQGWRSRPGAMPRAVLDQAAHRIGEHVRGHGLPYVNVILHGGEPLLAGADLISYAVGRLREETGTAARIQVQTNGVMLTGDFLQLFDELGVRVGVSVDGDRRAHDLHRRDRRGRGSYAAVSTAVRLLGGRPFRHLFNGLLCTVDPRHDPITTYEALLAFQPPAIDFLLPHANWANPPDGQGHGAWLVTVFDRWYGAPLRETRIRLFEEIVNGLLGGRSRTEAVGLAADRVVVIETDGAIERSDALKSAFEGAAATGLHVADHPFEAALRLPSVVSGQLGRAALCERCRSCPLSHACGGGMYAHRYRPGSGFANPSVYCDDLYLLIDHIRVRLTRDVAALRAETS